MAGASADTVLSNKTAQEKLRTKNTEAGLDIFMWFIYDLCEMIHDISK